MFRTVALTFTLMFAGNAWGQSMKGNHFWFGFMENSFPANDLLLMVVADSATTCTINAPAQGYTVQVKILPGDTIFHLDLGIFYPTVGSESIDDKGAELITNKYVRAYILNKDISTTDATPVLPFSTFLKGDKYMVQTLPGALGIGIGASFVVISPEDNTNITITPSAKTISGTSAGSSFNVTLDKGETFLVKAADNGDLSGSTITSFDGCGKFVVFSGSKTAQSALPPCTGSDHLFSQCAPISHFGTEYVIAPFWQQAGNYLVKITASEDNTDIFVNGVFQANINAKQSFNYDPFVPAFAKVCINTSKPTSVFQYMKSQSCNLDSGQLGDPSMIYIPQISRWTKKAQYGIFNVPNVNLHYTNIILPRTAIALLYIKTKALYKRFVDTTNFCNGYGLITLECAVGTYEITCDSSFYAYVYSKGIQESVAYLVGAEFFPFSSNFDLTPKNVCFNQQPISLNFGLDSFAAGNWDMDDGTTYSNINEVSHQYAKDGLFNVKVSYAYINSTCPSDTLTIPITVFPRIVFNGAEDKIVCEGEKATFSLFGQPNYTYKWNDGVVSSKREINQLGDYYIVGLDKNGCSDTQKFTISDSGCYDKRLRAFNIFTPNKDLLNDSWGLNHNGYSELKYTIYNRYGTMVNQGDFVKNEKWDGTLLDKQTLCPEGTYYYQIEGVVRRTKTIETYYGVITLVR